MRRLAMTALWILAAIALLLVLRLAWLSANAEAPATIGVTDGHLAPCPRSPNCVSSRADDEHRIAPLTPPGPVDDAMARAVAVVESMRGARVVRVDGDYLHAEFRSRLFRFVDDFELLWNAERGLFDVRSASRVGHSDLGANRRRVEALRTRLESAE